MISKIREIIDRGQRFLVTAHRSPDGDALGATLGLTCALNEMGKSATAYNRDGVMLPFDFLPGATELVDQLPQTACYDATFVLDAGELRRAALPEGPAYGALINIDHHPHSEDFGDIYYLDTEACATGVMIYRLLQAMDHPLSVDVATCLYTAIITDTGSFRYANANPEAFQVASALVEAGVNPWAASHAIYESNRLPRLRLLADVLETLDVAAHGRYAAVHSTLSMMQQTGAGPEDTDGFINYPRGLRGVEVAVYFRQISHESYKVGFRSQGKYDVGELSRQLGGGGHRNAAGVMIEGDLETVRQRVYTCLDALLG